MFFFFKLVGDIHIFIILLLEGTIGIYCNSIAKAGYNDDDDDDNHMDTQAYEDGSRQTHSRTQTHAHISLQKYSYEKLFTIGFSFCFDKGEIRRAALSVVHASASSGITV